MRAPGETAAASVRLHNRESAAPGTEETHTAAGPSGRGADTGQGS